jgi:hypothetical protein
MKTSMFGMALGILVVASAASPIMVWADENVTAVTPGAILGSGPTAPSIFGFKGSNLGTSTLLNVNLGRLQQDGSLNLIGQFASWEPNRTNELIGTDASGLAAPVALIPNAGNPPPSQSFVLGDFFAYWHQPLSSTEVAQVSSPAWCPYPAVLSASGALSFTWNPNGPPPVSITGPLHLPDGTLAITAFNPTAIPQDAVADALDDSGATQQTQSATIASGGSHLFSFSGLTVDALGRVTGQVQANAYVDGNPNPLILARVQEHFRSRAKHLTFGPPQPPPSNQQRCPR